MRRCTALVTTTAVVALLLAACGADGEGEGRAGFGLPTVSPDQVAGQRTDLSGTIHVEHNGCFTWTGTDGDASERRWVVWPSSGAQDDDHVTLGDGSTVTDGDAVVGTGLRTDAAALPDWDLRDSYFRAFGTYCGADERGIVVFDEIRRSA